MKLSQYIDSTYLKLPSQAAISEEETTMKVTQLIQEAIVCNFKLVMIRAAYIPLAKEMISNANSRVLVGTVVGFHEGTYSLESKIKEAQEAINAGVDELDFVVNYEAFINGNTTFVAEEIQKGTEIGLKNNKVVKWIIEVAALTNAQIASISSLIKKVVIDHFGVEKATDVFVKSSTGFYKTAGKPNGATFETVKIMSDNARPLKVKAAGGVKTREDALKMITLGVERIGTSAAKHIVEGVKKNDD